MPKKKTKAPAVLRSRAVNLALQGGGSHGAFTWGVLEALLDEPRLKIEGISGASAGAMNAVMLAAGLAKNGAAGAKAELEGFWRAVSSQSPLGPLQRAPLDALIGGWSAGMSQFFSPYQTNPLDVNPLKAIVRHLVDFKALKKCKDLKLFIGATNVKTGRARIFTREELSPEVLAASSCLPALFQAVKIGRDYYWDGGYMGNPPLWPLIYRAESRDIIIVQTSPITRNEVPRTPIEISERVNEISFNSSLKHEIRAIDFVARLLEEGRLDDRSYKNMLLHRIHDEALFDRFQAGSKMNTEFSFLLTLRKAGHRAGRKWLRTSYNKLGKTSSFDARAEYL